MKAMLLLLAVSASAMADDAALLRCRSIGEVAHRVACYDAIPLAATPMAPPVPAAAAASASAPASAPARTMQAPAASPVADKAVAIANFGLTATQLRKSDEPNTIESTIIGKIEGWSPRTQFRLANGQVWRVADDSSGSVTEIDNPKVVISRNALGTIFLEIEGSNQAPRVRRVQ